MWRLVYVRGLGDGLDDLRCARHAQDRAAKLGDGRARRLWHHAARGPSRRAQSRALPLAREASRGRTPRALRADEVRCPDHAREGAPDVSARDGGGHCCSRDQRVWHSPEPCGSTRWLTPRRPHYRGRPLGSTTSDPSRARRRTRRTVVLVAHRSELVAVADRIVHLERARVLETVEAA